MKKIIFINLVFMTLLFITGCGNKHYEQGDAVFFNPETGKKCSNYKSENSYSGHETGCMKWHVFDDNGDGTVDMILDHNLDNSVFYSDIYQKLEKNTETWHQDIKKTVRLIGADEIAKITGNTNFDVSTDKKSDGFYFESLESLGYMRPKDEVIQYHWLFDNLCYCETSGCAIVNNDYCDYDYATSTSLGEESSSYVWVITSDGTMEAENKFLATGIRPVITVSKSKL